MRDVIALRSELGDFITTTLILVGFAFVLAMGVVIVLFLTDDGGADIGNSEVEEWCEKYMPDTPRSECNPDMVMMNALHPIEYALTISQTIHREIQCMPCVQ